MAGVSTKEIKNRIRSMESTKQITKAMEMVASSKLRQAQNRVSQSRPYFHILSATVAQLAGIPGSYPLPYLSNNAQTQRELWVVIAGDRGLAGGYNSNIIRLCTAQMEGRDVAVLPVGKKAVDYFRSHGYTVLSDAYAEAEDLSIGDCFTMAKTLAKDFLAGSYCAIRLGYTAFDTVLSQVPQTMELLPLKPPEHEASPSRVVSIYEPDPETVFEAIVPEYLGGVLYGALCESRCSEQAARRTAMESATSNAEDMIADLSLKFNRARQASITNEIIDIVAGADA